MSIGVYISYPFCAQKCTFCNFASGVLPRELEREYVECLQAELRANDWRDVPDTVYLGGGTPSQMECGSLAALLDQIPGRPWVEATIEAAPGTITVEKAASWCEAGINRVSLGVQSFSARDLARTGRKHTAETVRREMEILRSARISNISIDLIAGLPGQDAASWQVSLNWLTALNPPHVSIYMLEVDEDSRLGQEVLLNGKRYGAPEVPSDESIAAFYETAVGHLRELGIERYEISNFSRAGSESRHNLKYWRLEPYLGVGADAHSCDGTTRYQNVETAAGYVERMRRDGSARSESQAARRDEEKFFVGLRLTEGVRPEPEEWKRWEGPIAQFIAQGLLERKDGRLSLTGQGIMYSNEVFAEFVDQ